MNLNLARVEDASAAIIHIHVFTMWIIWCRLQEMLIHTVGYMIHQSQLFEQMNYIVTEYELQ